MEENNITVDSTCRMINFAKHNKNSTKGSNILTINSTDKFFQISSKFNDT